MKKVLILTSVASMIDQFNIPHIALLQKMGYKVSVACNFLEGSTCEDYVIDRLKNRLTDMGVDFFQIDFERNIVKLKQNFCAYKQVEKILRENKYSFLHCHSPIGGVVGRFAGKRTGTPVIYTAHGFHFHKKTPKRSWMLYYPVEKLCSYFTDVLVTINNEDYALAKRKMKAKKVFYVPGVGVDILKHYCPDVDKKAVRKALGIPEDAILLTSVGEVNGNKNHKSIVNAIAKTGRNDIHYVIMGRGSREDELKELSEKLGIENRIHIIGFCDNVAEVNNSADIFCFPSYREGLGLAALEAMATGLPLITSDVHGINDYSENGKSGYKCGPDDWDSFAKAINELAEDKEKRHRMGEYNRNKVEDFSIEKVLGELEKIYSIM